jgi:WD40 repeat protein
VQIRPYILKENNLLIIPTGQDPWLVGYEVGADDYTPLFTPLPTTQAYTFAISPNQRHYAVGVNDDTAGLIMYFSSQPIPYVPPAAAAVALAYSPDNNWFAAVHVIPPYLTVYNRADMSQVVFSGLLSQVAPSAAQWGCDFSPDSNWLATCGDAANSFCLYDTATWNQVALTPPNIKIFDVKFSPDGTKVGVVSGELGSDSPNALGYYDIALGAFVWANFNFGTAEKYWGPPGLFMLHWLDDTTTLFVGMRCKDPSTSTNVMIWDWTNSYLTVLPTGLGDCWGGTMVPGTKNRLIEGTITDADGLTAGRTVVVFDSKTGKFLGETTSLGGSGTFSIKVCSQEPVFVIVKGEPGELSKLYD